MIVSSSRAILYTSSGDDYALRGPRCHHDVVGGDQSLPLIAEAGHKMTGPPERADASSASMMS